MTARPTPQPGGVWQRRDDGRLVVVASTNDESIVALEPDTGRQVRYAPAPFCVLHAHTGVAAHTEDPDGAPGPTETAALRGLQRRPSAWLRTLIDHARRHDHPELADLAEQVLVLRGENPGTREAPDA